MRVLNMDDIHLKFLLDLPVHIDGIGEFKAPQLKSIVELTENHYNTAVSSLLFDKSQVDSDEVEKYSNFQVLMSAVYHDSSFRELFFCGLNLHLDKSPIMHEQGFIYFDELSEETILTEEKIEYLKLLVRVANNIAEPKKEEYKAGNERAKLFMEKLKKTKASLPKKKSPINLHSIISAVGWKTKSFDFINNLNIYQLYDGYQRLGVIDNYHYTMQGIYAGTVDSSKIKLPDINWANVIK